MKLRLALTLSFERAPRDVATEDAPQVDEKSSAILERADAAPIGFTIPEYRSDPFEERRR